MAKVFIEETTLTAIGDAIRGKTGKTELIDPANMSTEIAGIEAGGGGGEDFPDILLTGNCDMACVGLLGATLIETYPNKVTTSAITSSKEMFTGSTLTKIPFDINYKVSASLSVSDMFSNATKLESVPRLLNLKPTDMDGLFNQCERLRYIPDDFTDTWNWSVIAGFTSSTAGNTSSMFNRCYSLRKIPGDLISHDNSYNSYSYSIYKNGFCYCYALDEIADIFADYSKANWNSNVFSNFVGYNYRLKRLTFALNPETNQPYQVKWKSQTIDLATTSIGYEYNSNDVDTYKEQLTNQAVGGAMTLFTFRYNAGLDPDKIIYNEETYQALKDDPDCFVVTNTKDVCPYSRYNHDSAVETLNTLPDTSAYLASAGGTNTIKFRGNLGSATDGGAINTLTAEEIAVATAKGWTVTLV